MYPVAYQHDKRFCDLFKFRYPTVYCSNRRNSQRYHILSGAYKCWTGKTKRCWRLFYLITFANAHRLQFCVVRFSLFHSRFLHCVQSFCPYLFFHFLKQTFDRIFQDYSETWWIILIGLAVSMIISLFWIVLMRFAAGFMVWLSILAILALQGVGKLIIISDVFYNLAVVID